MKSLGWFGNLIGEIIISCVYCAGLWLMGWIASTPIPGWGYYLAILCGMLAWSRPSYNRIQDFYED